MSFRSDFQNYAAGDYLWEGRAIQLRLGLESGPKTLDGPPMATKRLGLRHGPADRRKVHCYGEFIIGRKDTPVGGGASINRREAEQRRKCVHNQGRRRWTRKALVQGRRDGCKWSTEPTQNRKSCIAKRTGASALVNIIQYAPWPITIPGAEEAAKKARTDNDSAKNYYTGAATGLFIDTLHNGHYPTTNDSTNGSCLQPVNRHPPFHPTTNYRKTARPNIAAFEKQ